MEYEAKEGWIKCSTCDKPMFWVSTDPKGMNILTGYRLWCWDCRKDKQYQLISKQNDRSVSKL